MRNFSIVIITGTVLILTKGVTATMFFIYECVDDAIVVNGNNEEYFGSNIEANSIGKSSCGYNDKHAVWYSIMPRRNKTVTISLCGSAFDTTLAIFDSCGGTELACNDDYCDLQSELTIDLAAGQAYLIRVAGYNDQMGNYILTIVETDLIISLKTNNSWMYQNLPGKTTSNLTVNVSITDEMLSNSSYSYEWKFVLPSNVNIAPATVDGGGINDTFWTFAALDCDEPEGLSDSGQAFTVKVTVTGNDYGNTATAEIKFGIALLGDVDNNGVVNMIDRVFVNAFWQNGSAGILSLRDCDVDCDGVVDVKDRTFVNAIFQGQLGQDSVSTPCPLRYNKH